MFSDKINLFEFLKLPLVISNYLPEQSIENLSSHSVNFVMCFRQPFTKPLAPPIFHVFLPYPPLPHVNVGNQLKNLPPEFQDHARNYQH